MGEKTFTEPWVFVSGTYTGHKGSRDTGGIGVEVVDRYHRPWFYRKDCPCEYCTFVREKVKPHSLCSICNRKHFQHGGDPVFFNAGGYRFFRVGCECGSCKAAREHYRSFFGTSRYDKHAIPQLEIPPDVDMGAELLYHEPNVLSSKKAF